MAQINKPDEYFNTKLYTGNGSTGQSITGVGFQPDLIWFKNRTSAGYFHELYDVIRGVRKPVYSNANNSEGTTTASLESFDSDGFSVDSEDASGEGVNKNGDNYVAWNWLASNTTASNTDGSITSTVSANTTSGFSIVSYTGTGANATIGHGLGVAPKMVIIKDLSAVKDWAVYHASLGNTKYLEINTSDAEGTASNAWNNTSPTSSVVNLGSRDTLNTSGDNYIAYCFAPKKGFSAMGQYTGNGSTDGTFVYTGFKPAFLMIKNSSTGSTDWTICDSKRDGFNANNYRLFANTTGAESTSNPWEMYSNGFKMTTTGSFVNTSGDNFIYMAFAENPLVGTNNIPATAR